MDEALLKEKTVHMFSLLDSLGDCSLARGGCSASERSGASTWLTLDSVCLTLTMTHSDSFSLTVGHSALLWFTLNHSGHSPQPLFYDYLFQICTTWISHVMVPASPLLLADSSIYPRYLSPCFTLTHLYMISSYIFFWLRFSSDNLKRVSLLCTLVDFFSSPASRFTMG